MRSFLCALFGSVIGALSMSQPVADVFTGFEITARPHLSFGVPFVRSGGSYGENKPTALDVGPRGNPADHAGSGKAWLDVCNADLIANHNAPVSCFYAGAYGNKIQIGSRSFGAPVLPLEVRVGDTVIGRFTANGLQIFGTVTANNYVGANAPLVEEPTEPEEPPPPPPTGVEIFDGSGQFRAIPASPFGTGNFTYHFWAKSAQTTRADILTQDGNYTGANWHGALANVTASGKMAWFENSTAKITATVPWNNGSWHHHAWVRSAGVVTYYFDGAPNGTASSSFSYGNESTGLRLGAPSYGGGAYNGQIDDFALTNQALWTGAFTPPARSQ